ncbi:hypothetical protein EIN_523730 [Entamoeba invadens IP1]|uniref:EF-hand domain-containing protein n=1 Tax=Entamoeba invadens IP1 TaxID=370355 RepID=A0A0A1UEW3_ENTIV|nr:hypothetical protein EIN_523730 [Entamoeba invadens IP1]ELP92475.1 hypothetical protein EIN_523730 [Entamoeba invadens IP1]|eukprot:XP_004259246.1 hypothetical protein EIN_523730 [Entamoeba invadens IP1]
MSHEYDSKQLFKDFDVDSNGYIEKSEFIEGMRRVTGANASYDDVFEDIMTFVDGKGMINKKDGRLNKNEFDRIVKAMPKDFSNRKVAIATMLFNLIDIDKSGTIEMAEFHEYCKRTIANIKSADVKYVFESIDANGNGKVQLEEFMKWLLA